MKISTKYDIGDMFYKVEIREYHIEVDLLTVTNITTNKREDEVKYSVKSDNTNTTKYWTESYLEKDNEKSIFKNSE